MVFSSMFFLWSFLPVVLIVYYAFSQSRIGIKNFILLLSSILFYAWGEPVYILLMLLSIILNYCFGLLMNTASRKLFLILDVFCNLAILSYFKYCNFLIDIVNSVLRTNISDREIALPIGISFFTFQAMSYVIDLYRKECPIEKNIFNVALYISFFPQLIAGPIIKYKDIGYQIKNRKESLEKTALGIRRFCYGLGKKVIISNALAQVVDRIISMDMGIVNSSMAWITIIFYALQLYYDFSGYSDMAIGLGHIFGFDIPENFQYPYLSTSINEFWRRWHISLGTWFREYVYIPLGGSRKGMVRTYVNLFIVFLLTGIWHGASWNFVLWGIYNGFFIIVERLGLNKILKKSAILSHIYTLFVFGASCTLFRFTNIRQGLAYLKRMLMPWRYTYSQYSIFEIVNHRTWLIFVLAVAGCGILQKLAMKHFDVSRFKAGKLDLIYCTVIVWVCFGLLAGNTYNPFIYFRF
ncbi:MAG: MBOAT family protein [Lachnospiraceae bacterium]|nr:MBOAT family protein [Lachnospiraceae bacterium]